jgi:hypothetical protein
MAHSTFVAPQQWSLARKAIPGYRHLHGKEARRPI